MQEYTLSDVAKHKSKEKGIWIVLDNKVYDVTKFLDEVCCLIRIFGKKFYSSTFW